jgi:hypothetical protein
VLQGGGASPKALSFVNIQAELTSVNVKETGASRFFDHWQWI